MWYKAVDDDEWEQSIASNNDSYEKIPNLRFSMEYKIMVVVYNNRELSSSSNTVHIFTPEASQSITDSTNHCAVMCEE